MRRWTLATKKAVFARLRNAEREGRLEEEIKVVAEERGLAPEAVVALYRRLCRVLTTRKQL